jgi:hypothetical protein
MQTGANLAHVTTQATEQKNYVLFQNLGEFSFLKRN